MQQQQHELFESYEIKNWNFTPRLYKIFGAAAIFNILSLFIIAQANIFTTRGCDSPLVGNFCQVLDTIYLGSTLLNSSGDFESREYVKTELKDAEITFVDVTNAPPPLTYPAGYFALANPGSSFSSIQSPDMNGFPALPSPSINGFPNFPSPTINNGKDLMAIPQVTPTPNKKALVGNLPDSPFSFGDNPIGVNPVPAPKIVARNAPMRRYPTGKSKITKGSPSKLPDLGGAETAENKPAEKPAEVNPPIAPSEAVTDFKPNKLPLENFAADIIAKREDKAKPLDLTKNFKVRMVGELDKDGKLDPTKSRYTIFKPEEEGDKTMVDIGKAAIQAMNDSGLFFYLKDKGIDKVEITLIQDDERITAVINSVLPTKERAGTISSGLNGLLALAPLKVKEPELLELIKAAKAKQQGKNVVLNFDIDKLVAQAMITKKLQEAEAKKKAEEQNGKPNSTATVNPNQKNSK